MLVSKAIPNMINGVSQQPPALRLSSQAAEQINAYPSIVEGLKKRPPTEHIAKVISGTLGDSYIHTINRDTNERYVLIVTNGQLRVFDLAGNEKTVNAPSGYGYVTGITPSTDLRAITIADYTFILNTTKVVANTTDLSPNKTGVGLVYVKAGNYGQDYNVYINGTLQATKTTSTTDKLDIRTNTIAADLMSQLSTNLGAGWTLTQSGSTIYIVKDDGTDFDLKVTDSFGGEALFAFKRSTQRFSDLPVVAPKDYVVEVIGDNTSNFDNYYVKFTCENVNETFGKGVWEETIAPGIHYKLDSTTMPHTLIREANGTFTFSPGAWGDRTVGDIASSPDPSFVGATMNDIFFFKNRLGFLSGQNVIMSAATEFFRFYPKTVTTVLDGAPIDTSAGHTKVSILRHAVPFNEQLLLFSDQTQFQLSGGQILTQSTASIDSTTEYESSLIAKPVGAGSNVLFAVNKGRFSGMREYYVMVNSNTTEADDITSHVPQYVYGSITKMSAATNEDVVFVKASQEPNIVYVYKYFWESKQKLQNAWGKFDFGQQCTVLNFDFIETTAYFLMQYPDGVYLEQMSVEPGRVDLYSELYSTEGYVTLLDRRITEAQLTSATYDSSTGLTTLTLPYTITGTPFVVTRPASDGSGSAGRSLTIQSSTSNTLVVAGNYSAAPLYIGMQYSMSYTFSTPVMKEQSPGGGQNVISSGRLQILKWLVNYTNTGYFKAVVSPELRDVATYVFTGRIVGDGSNVLGKIPINRGVFTFPVMSRNDRVTIQLINDSFLPSHFVSAEFVGNFIIKSRRM